MVINKTLRNQLYSFALGFITGGYSDLDALASVLEALAREARKQADA